LERVRENFAGNDALRSSQPLLDGLNKVLDSKKIARIERGGGKSTSVDDEIPF